MLFRSKVDKQAASHTHTAHFVLPHTLLTLSCHTHTLLTLSCSMLGAPSCDCCSCIAARADAISWTCMHVCVFCVVCVYVYVLVCASTWCLACLCSSADACVSCMSGSSCTCLAYIKLLAIHPRRKSAQPSTHSTILAIPRGKSANTHTHTRMHTNTHTYTHLSLECLHRVLCTLCLWLGWWPRGHEL